MWRKFLAASVCTFTSTIVCDPNTFTANLPEYTWDEVSQHKEPGKSVWLVVGQGVYDVTNFIKIHPGGDKILLAAGKSADPFWNLYQVHKQAKVYSLLETLRIGNIKTNSAPLTVADPYINDPKREPVYIVHSERPFNAEVPNEKMGENLITPNSQFFIRNHLPVPKIDLNTYELELVFEEDKCTSFKFADLLQKFESVEVECSIQCAGNRRSEANTVGLTRGVEWQGGAIGNSVWKGVRVRDLLHHFGDLDPKYHHLHIEAYDSDPNGPFGTSIPLEKALHEDTILAYQMNGEAIPPDHGFPLRLIAPGYIGIRNIKWVRRLTVAEKESPLNWHRRDYRLFSPVDSMENVDFEKRVPVYESPVQSMILNPYSGASFDPKGRVSFEGFAYSGGGRGIARVELTADKGESWTEAELWTHKKGSGKDYGWTLWRARVDGEDIKDEVCVKAVDSAGNSQPENLTSVWNYRGLLVNSWHCIKMKKKDDN